MSAFALIAFLALALAAACVYIWHLLGELQDAAEARHARTRVREAEGRFLSALRHGDAPARPARSLITPVLATAHAQAMHEASTPHLPAGRHAAGLPRRDSGATLNRAPWETGSFPVPVDVTMVPAYGTDRCQLDVEQAERMERGLLT